MKKYIMGVLLCWAVNSCAMDTTTKLPCDDVYEAMVSSSRQAWEVLRDVWQSAIDARDAGVSGAVWVQGQVKKHWVATSLVCFVAVAVFFSADASEELRSKINDFIHECLGQRIESYDWSDDCWTITRCASFFKCTQEELTTHFLDHLNCTLRRTFRVMGKSVQQDTEPVYRCIAEGFKSVVDGDFIITDLSPSLIEFENFPSSWKSYEEASAACFALGGWILAKFPVVGDDDIGPFPGF